MTKELIHNRIMKEFEKDDDEIYFFGNIAKELLIEHDAREIIEALQDSIFEDVENITIKQYNRKHTYIMLLDSVLKEYLYKKYIT